jgi:hypothetical protein
VKYWTRGFQSRQVCRVEGTGETSAGGTYTLHEEWYTKSIESLSGEILDFSKSDGCVEYSSDEGILHQY